VLNFNNKKLSLLKIIKRRKNGLVAYIFLERSHWRGVFPGVPWPVYMAAQQEWKRERLEKEK